MDNVMETPTFAKQLKAFSALGPYVREPLSSSQRIFFDCLSTCVDVEKSAELREFWGWWLELTPNESGYEYNYWYGLFNEEGEWSETPVPSEHQDTVTETLERFFNRLQKLIETEFNLTITPAKAMNNPQILSAA